MDARRPDATTATVTAPKSNGHETSLQTTRIGQIVAATPMMKYALKMLLPRTVPSPTSCRRRSCETTAIASSGTEVPRATSVAPITNTWTPDSSAIPSAPRTTRRPARASSARPATLVSGTRQPCESADEREARRCRRTSTSVVTSHAAKAARSSSPSRRDNRPSKARIPINRGVTAAASRSRPEVSREAGIGEISSARPRISATLTTLLPRASPSEISGAPASAEVIAIVSSGLEVAKAAIVVATMPAEMRAQRASRTRA